MAKAKKSATKKATPPATIKRFMVKSHELDDTIRLCTIEGDEFTSLSMLADWEPSEMLKGSIVRVIPTPSATDEQIATMKLKLQGIAVAVRVLPRVRAGVIKQVKNKPALRRGAREVVTEMVNEAHTNNRDALRAYTETILGKAKL